LGSVFKGVTNAVKKVAGGVKDIVSSDLGKAALLAAGGYYLGGGSLLGAQRAGMSGFSFANLPGAGMVPEFLKGKTGAALGITALGGLFGGAMAGKSEEEVEALTRDVPALKSYLTQYYSNLNQKAKPEEIEQFVNSQIAEYNEGRGGYAMGGRMNYGMGSDGTMSPDEYFSDKEKYMKQKQMDDMYREYEKYIRDRNMNRDEVAMGGRMNYALGDTASQNAMQAAGVEGLPMRQNPKGVQELDLRDNGGFIPPVGIKEKEDDIPAMLSNNEFVFTADAVRGMGDGDVELGAQRMYDQMKTLEEGGRV